MEDKKPAIFKEVEKKPMDKAWDAIQREVGQSTLNDVVVTVSTPINVGVEGRDRIQVKALVTDAIKDLAGGH